LANPFLSDGDRTLFSRFGVSVRYIIGKTERYMRRINYEKGVVVGVYVADAGIIFVRYRLCGCAKPGDQPQAGFDTYFPMKLSEKEFQAQLAIEPAEKARGLMFRESLPEDGGMLFAYDIPQKASFWMKNTLIDLDIGFFTADGTLTQVKRMYANNLDSVSSARSDIAYCLEMKAGWFERNGITPPAKLDMPLLKKAVDARKKK